MRKHLINIGDFKTIKEIKSGSYGTVYSVQNKKTYKYFAAKVMKKMDDDDYDKRYIKKAISREISIMQKLQHPTIIKFIGYSLKDFNGNRNVTIFMSLATNGSLADAISKAQRSLASDKYDDTAKQIILVGVARGMMFLHQNQVIHRDLKPGNILLDENFHPHITDFGLSKFLGQDFNHTLKCGTPVYMAPEVLSDEQYDFKADVYSFGILMYEVVTDSIPYMPR